MDKTFSPSDIESRWYEQWEANNYFAPSDADEAFCIPFAANVTVRCTWAMAFSSHHGRLDRFIV